MRLFLGDFRADYACNGSDALRFIRQNESYDLLIEDFSMLEMRGMVLP
jgi:CheY-like chemotaxis protein